MRTARALACLSMALAAAGCGAFQDEGTLIFGPQDMERFRTAEAGGPAALEFVEARGPGFRRAMRLAPSGTRDDRRTVVAEAPVDSALRIHDVLLVTFYIRAAAGGPGTEAKVEIRMEPGPSRWSGPLRMAAPAAVEWRKYEYPFYLIRDYKPGEARLSFLMRPDSAGVEIGGLRLVRYGPWKHKAELPCTRLNYAGSEAGAAWRREAAERIERIRKGDLRVVVSDQTGAPIPGAAVSVRMKRHAYGFGSAVNLRTLNGERYGVTPDEVSIYKDRLTRLFNKTVFEGALKWPAWIVAERREAVMQAVQWLREQGLSVRGHVLVWPSWRWLPEEAFRLRDNPPALRRLVRGHIREEVTALKGQIAEWDVVNEPYSNRDLMDILGDDVMVEWFQEARRADPGAKLYINDYDILTIRDRRHRDHYEQTIRFLLEKGAPLDGIGLQGHFKSEVTPPEEVLSVLDRFAVFGKELQVTEFDIDTVDEQLQADYTRDLMTAVFSHPATVGFVMWGFWEKSHWIPSGAMFRLSWEPKPNAKAYEELVFHEWWTDEGLQTDAAGECAVRGFLGLYEVEVRVGDRTSRTQVELGKQGATVRLSL